MQTSLVKKLWPYLGAILIFLILTLAYVSPVLEGQRLRQPDIVNFEGMAREIKEFRAETGQEALWTNSMFGGMPAFQISVVHPNNIANHLHTLLTLGLPRPADMLFLYFIGFFIFMLLMGSNPWIALLGALGFAFSSYHFIIVEVGHNSKAVAIAYMAPVLGALIYAFRQKMLAGGLLFAIFLALQLFANHLQITYYLLIIVLSYGIFELYQHWQYRKLPHFIKTSLVLLAAAILAVGVNTGNFWSTYAYTKHTMRGGSELSITDANPKGLDKAYITNWSYGISETLTLLIPNAKGGATGALGSNSRAMNQVEPAYKSTIAQQNHYWGNQPFTSGPVYLGAVVMFLFVLSLFFQKGPLKWGLLVATILSLMLAWGKNFPLLTDFFIDYIPAYNKFRAVSMTLVIAELCIPIMAFLGLQQLYQNPEKLDIKGKPFLIALGSTAGLLLLLNLMPSVFLSFLSEPEKDFLLREGAGDPQYRMLFSQLEAARIAIFRADALRSFAFVMLAALILGSFALKKINRLALVVLLALLITLDMWPINRRYFDDSNFVSKRQIETPYQPTQANLQILQDPTPNFRVYNLSVNSFNESSTSWFHNSIGGYHGAKLQRYQELIDNHILKGNLNVLNMLNTRYFIVAGDDRIPQARFNAGALGHAWFVNDLVWVNNADEEIMALNDIDPSVTAVSDLRFKQHNKHELQADSLAQIWLTHYQPQHLKYQSQSTAPQLAVFSEIYYPDGWNAFLNGEPVEHFRVNYILRALWIPAGENEIEFRFEPRSYYTGKMIALVFSILLSLLTLSYIGWSLVSRKTAKS